MLRSLVCTLAICLPIAACGGESRPPAIDLNPSQNTGGAPDEGDGGSDGGGKKPTGTNYREGGFINLPQVSDILYDDLRGVLYVSTTQGGLATVNLDDGKISTQKIGDGPLLGLDLSPSGDKLLICENSVDLETMEYFVNVADFSTNELTRYSILQIFDLQDGTHSAAFANDDTVFLASSFKASGRVPTIRLDLRDGTYEALPAVRADSMFARSLDNSTVVMAEPKEGIGPIHVIDTSSLEMRNEEVKDGLYDVAINADASLLAFPIQDKLKLRRKDASGVYSVESTIDQVNRLARSAVFSPVSDSVYVTWDVQQDSGSSPAFVERYNVTTLESEGVIQNAIRLADVRVGGYLPTRMRISNDGTLLFITVETGINVIVVDP